MSRFRTRRWQIGLFTASVILTLVPAAAWASHGPPGTQLWGYEAADADAKIRNYDIGTDTPGPTCVPPSSTNGRGIALDPNDGNLWYTTLKQGFAGDGLIHKATIPPTCTAVSSIPFGDGPGGSIQDAVGALDIDPDDGQIWAAGYQPIGQLSLLYKVDRVTGSILGSCSVPFADSGEGNDTLAVAKLPGLGGSGKYLLTDAGELHTTLLAVDVATCTGGGAGTIVTTFTLPAEVTGIDYESNQLIASTMDTIIGLGGAPFSTIQAQMPTGTGLEDITLQTAAINRPPDCSTATASPSSLWPPNHKLRLVTVAGVTDPDGDPVTISITGVTQDEPLNGTGDGNTSPDAAPGPSSNQVLLRSERRGAGDGRVYRISFTASDGRGGTCRGTVFVGVPHDRGGGSTPIDTTSVVVNSFGP
jgi:Bacterial Ig domain